MHFFLPQNIFYFFFVPNLKTLNTYRPLHSSVASVGQGDKVPHPLDIEEKSIKHRKKWEEKAKGKVRLLRP